MHTLKICRRLALLMTTLLFFISAWTSRAADDAAPAAGNAAEAPPRLFKEAKTKAAIITIDREIDNVIFTSIKRRVKEAEALHCDVIVFEINTGGGYMANAFDVTDYVRNLSKEGLFTVAYVHNTAMNTAALLAFSCKYIVVSPDATLGNIPPGGEPGAGPREKELARPILEDLKKSCDLNHQAAEGGTDPYLLARAMVEPEIEIFQIQKNNAVRFIDEQERQKLFPISKDGAVPKESTDGWNYVDRIDNANDYLTTIDPAKHAPSGQLAVDMGLAKTVIENDGDLQSALRVVQPFERLDLSLIEKAVLWLTTWPVRGTLFVLMMMLAWIEFSHPGISIAGIGAVFCLALLVGAPFMTGLAQAWEILLIVAGVAIIALDLILYGGIGMFAIPGFILMAIGLVASFVPSEPGAGWSPTPQQIAGLQKGFTVVIFGTCIAVAGFFLMAKYLYMTPGFRRIQLAPPNTTASETGVLDNTEHRADDAVFIGALGKAASDLRPAGQARFGPHIVDVITQGQFINLGDVVEVAEIRGNKITVRPATQAIS